MMIRIRDKNCPIEVGNGNELFCSFDLYWSNSKDELLHPDYRCIDIMVKEIINESNNTRTLMTMNLDGTPITLKSFHASLKDNGVPWCPDYRIYYRDDENDDIPIDSDWEYEEALKFLLSRNENTGKNVMMIIKGDIQKINNELGRKKTMMQQEAPIAITPMSSATNNETVVSEKNTNAENDNEPERCKTNFSNGTRNVPFDTPRNDDAFDMLHSYLENFKKEIVNDVVKIVEEKLLSAFGKIRNDDVNLHRENPIHEAPIQENSHYEEIDTRFRRMRDEMQKYNRPLGDNGNIRSRPFSVPLQRLPTFAPPVASFMPWSNPPTIPPLPIPNAFAPFMSTSEFEKYVSLLAQGAASSQLAYNMFAKCNNNSKTNNTQESKSQKESNDDNTEAMEVPENIIESPTDSSSFEILSADSSPTNIDDDNSSSTKQKYKTMETYDCISDEESRPIGHGNIRNPTFIVQSTSTIQKPKSTEIMAPELDKRPGGTYSYVSGTLLPTSTNGMIDTDAGLENNGKEKISSENNKCNDVPLVNKNQSSANHQTSNGSNYNRSSGMNSHMNMNRHGNLHMTGSSIMNNDLLQNKRNGMMNSLHSFMQNERNSCRQMLAPNPYWSADGQTLLNPRYPDEYLSYSMDDFYRRFHVSNSGLIDPFPMSRTMAGAYDAAQEALSFAREVMDRNSKTLGSPM